MSKFGELINTQVPVLIDFYTDWNESSVSMHPVIRDVAAALGDKAKVIKIDVDKNQELADALRIKGLPTLMIYKQWAGLYENLGRYVYVNRGFGFHAYPGRVGIMPEITVIELKKGTNVA